jgi:uncharacterized Zn finger protein
MPTYLKCPQCGSEKLKVTHSRGWLRYRRCSSCGLRVKSIEKLLVDAISSIDPVANVTKHTVISTGDVGSNTK